MQQPPSVSSQQPAASSSHQPAAAASSQQPDQELGQNMENDAADEGHEFDSDWDVHRPGHPLRADYSDFEERCCHFHKESLGENAFL